MVRAALEADYRHGLGYRWFIWEMISGSTMGKLGKGGKKRR